MRILHFTIALLILPCLCLGQPNQYAEVGATPFPKPIPAAGKLIQLVDQTSPSDTLDVWVQHAGPRTIPSYAFTKHADAVLWCYPNLYPHKKHLMPQAKGEIVVFLLDGNVVLTERGSQAHLVYSQHIK